MLKNSWAFLAACGLIGAGSACGSSGGTNPGGTADAGSDGALEGGFGDSGSEAGADGALAEGGFGEAGPDGTLPDSGGQDGGDGSAACGWTSFSDGLSGATMGDVMFDQRAQPPVAYATSGKSIYVSSDSGHTWRQQGTFSGGSIGFLAAPGTDPNVLLASSTGGVIKSMDAGATWSLLSFDGQGTSSIAAAPSQSLRVYVGVRGSGVFRSADGGATWSAINNGYPYMDTLEIDVAPDNADEVVAGGPNLNAQNGYSSTGVVMRTTDGGQTWQTVVSSDGVVWNLRRCTSDATVLYAATDSGVARSADRGATWTLLPTLGGQVEDVAITPGACNDVYAMVHGAGPRHSTDGGQTFGAALTQGLELMPPSGRMAVSAQSTSDIVLGSHGGIFYSTDGATWSTAQGLLGMIVQELSVSPLDPAHLWLSSWGSGVWQRPSPAQPWQRVSVQALPLDYAFTVAADPYTANRVLVGAGAVYLSNDDGATFTAGTLSQNELSFAFDSTDAGVIYATTQLQGVNKSTNGGSTWTPSNSGLTPWTGPLGAPFITVSSLVVDPASHQTLYIGTNGRGVYKSSDGAQSWTSVLSPMAVIQCLLAVPGTQTATYACVGGGGVQRSTDGGATWTAVSDGLPTLDVNGLALDSATGDLYATTVQGVYVKHGTQSWTGYDATCLAGTAAGAPAIIVDGTRRSLVVAAAGSVYAHPL